jgi:rhodanese-related sulfurtransferase
MKLISGFMMALTLLFASAVTHAADAPMTIDGATTVDSAQAKALFDEGALFIDPRRTSEFDAGRIPDAVSLEMKQAFSETSLAEVAKKDDKVVFYCNGPKCPRSAMCSEKAIAWGYTQVFYYRDGFPAWKSAGYPVE